MSLRTPYSQTRNQYGRDWGNYQSPDLLPNRTGFVAPVEQLQYLEAGDTAYVDNQGRWYCEYAGSAPGAGDAIWRSSLVTMALQEVTRTITVSGQQAVFLPWGQYVLAQPGWAFVWLNGVPLTFGSDWDFQKRQARTTGWPYASTADASTGVWLNVGTNAGDTVRVQWRTGRINLPPPSMAPVYAPGGSLPPSPGVGLKQRWPYTGSPYASAFVAANLEGFQVEVWRMTRKSGRVYGTVALPGFAEYRRGRVYVPLYRAPSVTSGEVIISPGSDFSESSRKGSYRICYYDPATGARTDLSAERLFWSRTRNDFIRTAGLAHQGKAAWTVG